MHKRTSVTGGAGGTRPYFLNGRGLPPQVSTRHYVPASTIAAACACRNGIPSCPDQEFEFFSLSAVRISRRIAIMDP